MGLDLWPPDPTPAEVMENDCMYEDTTVTLNLIAQRFYNDENRRKQEALANNDVSHERLVATTAMFITEFADQNGITLPEMSPKNSAILDGFMARVKEWEDSRQDFNLQPIDDRGSLETWFGMLMTCIGQRGK